MLFTNFVFLPAGTEGEYSMYDDIQDGGLQLQQREKLEMFFF